MAAVTVSLSPLPATSVESCRRRSTTLLSLSPSVPTCLGSSGGRGRGRRITGTHSTISRLSSFLPQEPTNHLPFNIILQQKDYSNVKCAPTNFSSPQRFPEEESHPYAGGGRNILWVFLPTCFFCILLFLGCGGAVAATVASAGDSIKTSKIGLKIVGLLRATGVPDEAIVFVLAALPVLELRGAIPVGYWMHLNPLVLTALAILGNTLPVPFILLYLKTVATFLSLKRNIASLFLDALLRRTRDKAKPVQEFRWLGLMLFVAVPFPGTGAWSGAIVASLLDMPFWPAVSANFFGVILAGLLVNLLVNLGLKYAVATGVLLFFASTVMWSVLRHFKKTLHS